MTTLTLGALQTRGQDLLPGLIASAIVAAAASFLSEHYGAPVMLFALLLGMSMNFLATESKCKPGIEFTAREVLRIGVALLGIRITFGPIAALGHRLVLQKRRPPRRCIANNPAATSHQPTATATPK